MVKPVAKIGLLGGTFNPIHIGHLRSAIEVAEQLALDELRLIPNALPPHRETPSISASHRLAMVQLAASNTPLFAVDDRELKRDKPSYTFDTLHSIHQELAVNDILFFIMGWDAFCGLPSWYRWQELLNYCHILVLQRPHLSAKIPPELQTFIANKRVDSKQFSEKYGQIAYIQQTPLDISSTKIRNNLAQGKSVQFLLPETVLDYINQHQLYQ
ncbi:nicotinate-nucleotide adenylyltransferase [Entomomonas asaccharolytica]|uniref:Probable nicotinate-nucleotide adenylyltransferase n=1 Tax=Entomomonas asaccharolytica TaxID=2785331 RepID=A0A974RYD3_9GAMM|nr:nicotinate-nucleotide adenylyltransferase [Entomomonas asaccharolytica]QQP85774.1 nicotinate-nucleotide adenylyltransferase [Entomomonas asaccharolytica]